MRADNRGEGGIFALTILTLRAIKSRYHRLIMVAGLIGGSLFLGDSVLTPAISVISAVEGLEVKAPELRPFVLPLTLALLILLFVLQRRGTARVGGFFGPIIIVWFGTLGLLGIAEIARNPAILKAINPLYGIELIVADPVAGFILLGSVVLAVTGAEALYADMGHFGRMPIRRAWLYFVFPALLLNYFGQGALLLADPGTLQNPFYRLAPDWGVYPLVMLASAATVLASVLAFRSSNALGSAYGVAVTGTMTVDTTLGFIYLALGARWSLWLLVPLFAVFATVDLSFFSANLLKVAEGGWYPILVAGLVFSIMGTWWRGRRLIAEVRARDAMPLDQFIDMLNPERPVRVPGTAIFMTRDLTQVPVTMLHAMKHTKALQQRVVIMQVDTEDVPHVPDERRLEIAEIGKGFFTMRVRYGFMDEPNVMRALAQCRVQHFH